MTDQLGETVDIKKLKLAYGASAVHRAAFDHFAGRGKNSTQTAVDTLQKVLNGAGATRGDVIEFFKALDDAGCGRFLVGRKGYPSRFEWKVNLISVGRAAAGELKEVEALSEAERAAASDNDGDGGLIEHRFVLREGFELRIELPADFTAHEAARVADFVKALPFGSDR